MRYIEIVFLTVKFSPFYIKSKSQIYFFNIQQRFFGKLPIFIWAQNNLKQIFIWFSWFVVKPHYRTGQTASIRYKMFTLLLIAADAYRNKNTPTYVYVPNELYFVLKMVFCQTFLNWSLHTIEAKRMVRGPNHNVKFEWALTSIFCLFYTYSFLYWRKWDERTSK